MFKNRVFCRAVGCKFFCIILFQNFPTFPERVNVDFFLEILYFAVLDGSKI